VRARSSSTMRMRGCISVNCTQAPGHDVHGVAQIVSNVFPRRKRQQFVAMGSYGTLRLARLPDDRRALDSPGGLRVPTGLRAPTIRTRRAGTNPRGGRASDPALSASNLRIEPEYPLGPPEVGIVDHHALETPRRRARALPISGRHPSACAPSRALRRSVRKPR